MKCSKRWNKNKAGLKNSCDQYRNINGKFFEHQTSDRFEFDALKKHAKEQKLSYRIINDEFYLETNRGS